MGRTVMPRIPPPLDPEQMLRAAFISGRITVEQFEDAIGEALQGIWDKTAPLVLPKPGGLPSQFPRPTMEQRL